MSPPLPISRSSSSSSFYFVHPDKNSLNGIPDCTKMAHITVLKESHHSKFQLAAALDIVALCKNDSISEVKLTRRSSRLSRKLTRGENFWIGAVYLCELLLLYVTFIYTGGPPLRRKNGSRKNPIVLEETLIKIALQETVFSKKSNFKTVL